MLRAACAARRRRACRARSRTRGPCVLAGRASPGARRPSAGTAGRCRRAVRVGPVPRQRPTVVNRSSASCVAKGQSSSTTGCRVWRHSIPDVGSSENCVPTLSPIVKWRSCPSMRGAGRPDASHSCVKPGSASTYTARRAACLSAVFWTSPAWLTNISASRASTTSSARVGPCRLSPSSPISAAAPSRPKRRTTSTNQGRLTQDTYPRPRSPAASMQWLRDSSSTQKTS